MIENFYINIAIGITKVHMENVNRRKKMLSHRTFKSKKIIYDLNSILKISAQKRKRKLNVFIDY